MHVELSYLVWVTVLTGLIWVPYMLGRIAAWGMKDVAGYPPVEKPQPAWALRLKSAHENAVENLVVFAPLVLAAQVLGISTGATVAACAVYFWARVVHVVAYAFAVPWVRTLAFLIGVGAQLTLAWQILVG